MDSLNDIWQSVMQQLGEKLTPTAVNTWLSDCKPVELGDRRIVVQTTSEFKRSILQQRFSSYLRDAFADLFSLDDFDVIILLESELQDYFERKKTDDVLPEALDYTFDRFIVGNSNRWAHSAAVAVSENPGKAYNPLFIYGHSGLGKTHLLLAIGQSIRERNPNVKLGYVKGDEFTNQMVHSLRTNTQEEFRNRYRKVDLLLADDIQFISGKEGVQEEFFHTFNAIYEAGHQIVLTADRPPKDMASLHDRLRSRFEGGLIVDIQPPDIETRMAIIRNKAQRLGLLLSDDVVDYIAENITANIRQIEGVVNRLTAYRDISNGAINISSVKRAIEDVIRTGVYIPTPEVIITETGRYFGIDEKEIRGQRRTKNTAMARQIAMYLMRTLTNLSLEDIGEQFENRNHSTVLSSTRKVEDLLKTDPEMPGVIRDITSNINSIHDR